MAEPVTGAPGGDAAAEGAPEDDAPPVGAPADAAAGGRPPSPYAGARPPTGRDPYAPYRPSGRSPTRPSARSSTPTGAGPVRYPPVPGVPGVPGGRRAAARGALLTRVPLPAPGRGRVVAVGAVLLLVAGVGVVLARTVGRAAHDDPGRDVWEATSLRLPDHVLDIPRQPAARRGAELTGLLGPAGTLGGGTAVGVYGRSATAAPAVVVVAHRAPEPMSAAAQKATWDGFVRAVPQQSAARSLVDRDPGRLGGRAACGTFAAGPVLCLSVDQAALVAVVGAGDVPGGAESLARVRETVEQRS